MICGDIHVRDRAPSNCHDSYTDDIIDILKWTADYCASEGIKHAIWAGDVFDFKSPSKNSHALVLKMIGVVRHYIEQGVELSIVPGNHDLSNDVLDTIHTKQPLGVLYAAGAHELKGWHPDLPVYGVPWQQTWTTDPELALLSFEDYRLAFESLNDTARVPQWSYDQPCLVVTHAPIYPPAQVERGVPFDLVDTKRLADAMHGHGYLYYGHIHEDHGIFTDGGVTFANMGAISRGSLHEYNLERTVKVSVWTDEPGEEGFTEVIVPQKPASEVFKIESASLAKAEKMNLNQFLTSVGSASLDISTTASVVAHLRELNDVPEEVITRAVDFLEAVDA